MQSHYGKVSSYNKNKQANKFTCDLDLDRFFNSSAILHPQLKMVLLILLIFSTDYSLVFSKGRGE